MIYGCQRSPYIYPPLALAFDRINIKKNKKGVFENIPDKLDNYNDFLNCEYVLIENQPCMKNPTMKSIQIILYSYKGSSLFINTF